MSVTFATATMMATFARASETGEGGAGSGRDDAAIANGVGISLGERDRACSGRDDAAIANGVGTNLGERERAEMVYT